MMLNCLYKKNTVYTIVVKPKFYKSPESGHTEISQEKLLKKATQKVQKQTPDKWPQ